MAERHKISLFTNTTESFDQTLIEQYKAYIEAANLTSSLRSQANTFFITINTVIMGFIVGIVEFSSRETISIWLVFACITGLVISYTWLTLLRSYRNLNSGRYHVIQQIEERLPARIYAYEYEFIHNRPERPFTKLSIVEERVPLIFGGLYILLGVVIVGAALV